MTDRPFTHDQLPLKRRVYIASAWSMAGHGVGQTIRFASNLVMTRLLVPEMFGVMAIATVIMIGLGMFSDLGVRQSIVQSRRGSDPAFLNTAWSIQVVRGFALWAIAVAVAAAIALTDWAGGVAPTSVYANPSLPYVICVLSFGAVIGGFGTTKIFEASRSLSLGRITRIELLAQLAGLSTMLIWANFDRSVWTLVAGALTASLVGTVAGHAWLTGVANRWQWDPDAARELTHFGKWIFAASILGFLVTNADRVMLGGMVDATTFGVYTIACLMIGTFDQLFARIMGGVVFPAISEVVRGEGDLSAVYYRFHRVIAPIAYICAGFLSAAGPVLVATLYDHRYADAGWMLQILAIGLLVTPFQIGGQGYLALGMSRRMSNLTALRLVALGIALPVGFHLFGIEGAIFAVVLSQLSTVPLVVIYNIKSGMFDVRRELLLLPIVLAGFLLGKFVVVMLQS